MTGRRISRRMNVAGTAGGVGTSTVTALCFSALRDAHGAAPSLLDHTAGTLGARLADGDEVARLDDRWRLQDLGPVAHQVSRSGLDDPETVLTVVSAATPVGLELTGSVLDAVGQVHGSSGLGRTVVVLVGVFGRYRLGRSLRTVKARDDLRGAVLLPPDPALAAGGRIPLTRLSRATRRGVDELCGLLTVGRRVRPTTWSWTADEPVSPGQHADLTSPPSAP